MHTKQCVSLDNTQDQAVMNQATPKLRDIQQNTYQHKTVSSAVRLLFGKLRNNRLQVLSGE